MGRSFLRLCTAAALTTILAGCAQVGVPTPPSLELPKPVNDLKAARKGDHVALKWTAPTRITEGGAIKHFGPTRICRSLSVPMSQCDSIAGEIEAEPAKASEKSFTDRLPGDLIRPEPDAAASYAVEVMNADGRSAGLSNQVTVPLLPTLPAPDSLRARVLPDGVSLTWEWPAATTLAPGLAYKLRIYRRSDADQNANKVGEVDLGGQQKPEFLDSNPDWEKTFFYYSTWVTTVGSSNNLVEVEGDDSPEIKVFVHDVFPPAIPTGLQAVFSSVGQPNFIDLTWSPNTDADLAGYNVYRHADSGTPVKINAELAKIPTYRDREIQPGKKYFYSVSAVDLRGNESGQSEEASENVPGSP